MFVLIKRIDKIKLKKIILSLSKCIFRSFMKCTVDYTLHSGSVSFSSVIPGLSRCKIHLQIDSRKKDNLIINAV